MDIKDLLADIKNTPDDVFEQRLNKLIRDNFKFKNLDANNKKTVLDLLKKYKNEYLKKGRSIPSYTLRNDMYKLGQNRVKLGMSENDLEDVKAILSELA